MTPEQLQAALNALMGAGLEGDALAAATKALTDAFSGSVEATDEEVTDAMPAAMRAAYDATDLSAEDKAEHLENARSLFRAGKVSVLFSAALVKAKGDPAKPGAQLTKADVESVVGKLFTSTFKSLGHVPKGGANPIDPSIPKTGPTAFSAKIKTFEKEGATNGKAILMARNLDRNGFNDWVKAGRPV